MATETTNNEGSLGSDAMTEKAADGGPGIKDILVDSSEGGTFPAGGESAVPSGASESAEPTMDATRAAMLQQEVDALHLQDVLLSSAQENAESDALGVFLKIETVGSNTVISVDADGGGVGAAVPVVTLQNVTNVTLADLLNNIHI